MTRKMLTLTSGLVLITLTTIILAVPVSAASATPGWSKTYGGANVDRAYAMIKTNEGGYAMVGTTNSFGAGIINAFVVKTDGDGNLLWNQTYSGLGQGIADAIVQASDNGYAITGYSYSLDESGGGLAAWVLKTDFSGVLEWNQTFPELGTAIGYSILQTSDGGFAFVGTSNSIGNGGKEGFLAKLNSTGKMEWNLTYGGVGDDEVFSVIQTSDSGFILGGDTSPTQGGPSSLWLIKTDNQGVMQWNKTYGNGNDINILSTLVRSGDGGYAIIGTVIPANGTAGDDYLLVKVDSSGNVQWTKTYSASTVDDALGGIQTGDGGYALVGVSNSSGSAFVKAWLVKADANGNQQWNQTYGGVGVNVAGAIVQTADGGYVLGGYSNSTGFGQDDFWLVKTDAAGIVPELPTLFIGALIVSLAIPAVILRRKMKLKNPA